MYPYPGVGAAQAAPEAPPPRVLTDRGWVTLFPMSVYSNKRAQFEALPLEALVESLVWAEKQHTLDRIDDRNKATVTMEIGDAVGHSRTKAIEVPEDEIWYLCGHEICVRRASGLTAGDLHCNFRVSSFPKTDDTEKLYYSTDKELIATQAQIAAGDVCDHRQLLVGAYWDGMAEVKVYRPVMRDFRDWDELNTELRLVGGDKLTLVVTVATVATAGAAVDVDLIVWGRKGKRLVE